MACTTATVAGSGSGGDSEPSGDKGLWNRVEENPGPYVGGVVVLAGVGMALNKKRR